MPSIRCANKEITSRVMDRRAFQANSARSANEDGNYTVYSYAEPVLFYSQKDGRWYGTNRRWSVTTSRLQNAIYARTRAEILPHEAFQIEMRRPVK